MWQPWHTDIGIGMEIGVSIYTDIFIDTQMNVDIGIQPIPIPMPKSRSISKCGSFGIPVRQPAPEDVVIAIWLLPFEVPR